MWIVDSAYRDGGIDLWTKEQGHVKRVHHPYDPPFYVTFADPDLHAGMIAALEEQFGAEECSVRTIFGEFPGYAVYAGRDVAEAIERQAQYGADLFDVDVRRDQRFLAEHGIFPCAHEGKDRFSPEVAHDLSVMEISIGGNPARSPVPARMDISGGVTVRLEGDPEKVTAGFLEAVASADPDAILMTDADLWMPGIRALAKKEEMDFSLSRNGKYRQMSSRSYWSYGKMEHKEAALIPDGRILIDTEQSFVFREGGLAGVLMASRLSGLSPNLASRLTPGTLVSSCEIYEALKQGIAVPFRKNDPEQARRLSDLRAADRGGMMFQPVPGVYENVEEIDYTSMYPSIIADANLSPETVGHPERAGFLPAVLRPLLGLRRETKRLKKTNPAFAGTDAILKWMLVTCFGYTGYRNAKFGRIEVHEGITARSREILVRTKEIAEEMGFTVLHGIVDCLWVQGPEVAALMGRLEKETGMYIEAEHFDWIVFLPLADGFGAYNRYYGRQPDGSVKVRGIAARRHDTPDYVREMQREILTVMARAATVQELRAVEDPARQIYRRYREHLPGADPQKFIVHRRIGRLAYAHRCIEAAAVRAYREAGVTVAPGMKIAYVVRDAQRYIVDTEWDASAIDAGYYRALLDKAWEELHFAFMDPGKDLGAVVKAGRESPAGDARYPVKEHSLAEFMGR